MLFPLPKEIKPEKEYEVSRKESYWQIIFLKKCRTIYSVRWAWKETVEFLTRKAVATVFVTVPLKRWWFL